MERDTGFTLVELMITIVVVSILLAMGAPAFKDFIKNNRVTAQANDVVSVVQLARNEALKRGSVVTICASSDQATCDVTDQNWKNGWIAFSDLNRDGDPNSEDGSTAISGNCSPAEDCVVRTSNGLQGGATLTANVNSIRYLPTGFPDENDIPVVVGPPNVKKAVFTLTADHCERNQAREITVTLQGHTLISEIPCP